ncbi:MAG TPA: heme exporter protein CcmB [Candidatus Polarisedimenticolia bacterium]|nr:heme exporter protein CcmB [Candidatus Polarisedimenticolia bacterium]
MDYLKTVALVAGKDLRTELRSRDQVVTLLFFALLVLVVFNFAFDFTVIDFVTLGAGVLWVAFIFSGVLALSHSFQIEREEERIQGILLAPIDRSAFYLGKVLATILFMSVVEAILVPVSVLMFNYHFSAQVGLAILVLILNTIGFAAVGTLFSAMTTRTRRSELLLPLLLFPAAVPVALAAVKTTSHVLAGRPFERYASWLALSAAYDLIFLSAAVLLFDFVLEE